MCELEMILTPRQMQIALLAVKGYTNKEIANKLGISLNTLNHHLFGNENKEGMYARLGITKDRQIFKALWETHYIEQHGLAELFSDNEEQIINV